MVLAVLVLTASSIAAGEPLLDFRGDLAFRPEAVESFAQRAYTRRLAEFRADGRLDHDSATLERISDVLGPLREAAGVERPDSRDWQWQVHSCARCAENASAMAGGGLLFGEEFLAQLNLTRDELGFLVAHEMAHVLAEHTREFATVARYFVDNGARREYWDIQREVDDSLAVQYRMAFVAEQQELDADRIGFILGARAGFDPAAMLGLLSKLDGDSQTSLLADHPSIGRRVAQAITMLQMARTVRTRLGVATPDP
jgi:predicted Zn-dependent protease